MFNTLHVWALNEVNRYIPPWFPCRGMGCFWGKATDLATISMATGSEGGKTKSTYNIYNSWAVKHGGSLTCYDEFGSITLR